MNYLSFVFCFFWFIQVRFYLSDRSKVLKGSFINKKAGINPAFLYNIYYAIICILKLF